MTSRTHQIYNIVFEHGFDPPTPVWTMLKKTALFLREGFTKPTLILSYMESPLISYMESPLLSCLIPNENYGKSFHPLVWDIYYEKRTWELFSFLTGGEVFAKQHINQDNPMHWMQTLDNFFTSLCSTPASCISFASEHPKWTQTTILRLFKPISLKPSPFATKNQGRHSNWRKWSWIPWEGDSQKRPHPWELSNSCFPPCEGLPFTCTPRPHPSAPKDDELLELWGGDDTWSPVRVHRQWKQLGRCGKWCPKWRLGWTIYEQYPKISWA